MEAEVVVDVLGAMFLVRVVDCVVLVGVVGGIFLNFLRPCKYVRSGGLGGSYSSLWTF